MNRGNADEDLDRQVGNAFTGGLMLLVCLVLLYTGRAYRWPAAVNLSVPIAVACCIGAAVMAGLARRRADRQFHTDWRVRRRTCHHCGYDLQGLKSPVRCPECGKSHLPRVT